MSQRVSPSFTEPLKKSAVFKGATFIYIFTDGVNLNAFAVDFTVVHDVSLSGCWMILDPEIHDLVLTFISVRFSEYLKPRKPQHGKNVVRSGVNR